MAGIYALDTSGRLFEKLVRDLGAFFDAPSEEGIFNVIFPLYHLREWVCPGGYDSYKAKLPAARSHEEELHATLHTMPEYKVVRALCNRAKHYTAGELGARTSVVHGLSVGYGRVGDSLGITHFLVDGIEIRDIFWPVYMVYFAHFRGRQSA